MSRGGVLSGITRGGTGNAVQSRVFAHSVMRSVRSDRVPTHPPSCRIDSPLNPREENRREDTEQRERKGPRSVPLPPDFELTAVMRTWALEHTTDINVEKAHENFIRRHHRGKGTRAVDFHPLWEKWVLAERADPELAKTARQGVDGTKIGADASGALLRMRWRPRRVLSSWEVRSLLGQRTRR